MLKTFVTSAILLALGLSAVHAAPGRANIGDERTIDRFVEIRDPGQLVGPQIDPTGPLKGFGTRLEPEPDPWYEHQFEIRGFGH